jgi:hypothetical protein
MSVLRYTCNYLVGGSCQALHVGAFIAILQRFPWSKEEIMSCLTHWVQQGNFPFHPRGKNIYPYCNFPSHEPESFLSAISISGKITVFQLSNTLYHSGGGKWVQLWTDFLLTHLSHQLSLISAFMCLTYVPHMFMRTDQLAKGLRGLSWGSPFLVSLLVIQTSSSAERGCASIQLLQW